MTVAPTALRELVRGYFEACVSRDARRIASYLHDDIIWSLTGPVDVFTYCGQRRGKAAVIDAVVRLGPTVIRINAMELDQILVEGDRAATFMRIGATHSATGRVVSYRGAQFLRFRDGKLIEFQGLMDSFDAAEQVLGHPIEVAPGLPAVTNVFAV